MSQTDFDVANASGATVRADINAHLDAMVTLSSRSSAPSTTFPNQWWLDTSTNILKQRDNANTAWVNVALKTGTTWIPYRNGVLIDAPSLAIIESGIISAASTLDIINLTTDFRAYEIAFDDLLPVTDGQALILQTDTNNGASFEAGASDYSYSLMFSAAGAAVAAAGSNGTTGITVTNSQGNVAGEEASGKIIISNPMDAGSPTKVNFQVGYQNSASDFVTLAGSGMRKAGEANNAIRLKFGSGNIAAMNYTLSGLRES